MPALGGTRAAIVPLVVPVIAAAAAVPLLGETIDARMIAAAALVLGGVALAIVARRRGHVGACAAVRP